LNRRPAVRQAAALVLTDKAVRVKVDYLENSGRLAKVRFGYRTVFFGIGMNRDELRQKIAAIMTERAQATRRASENRRSDLEWSKTLRREIAAAKGKTVP
jgi:glutamate dehydrogenase/leucine dehydrogenase